MKLTGENGYGMPDDYADAHAFLILCSMCRHDPSAIEDLPEDILACIRSHLSDRGLADSAGRPTEEAYDLFHRIPVDLLGTFEADDGRSVSAVCVRGHEDSEEKDAVITGSGAIIACVNNGSVEVYGTEDMGIACNIGFLMGSHGIAAGDLVLAAVSEDPCTSRDIALSLALKVA